MFVYSLFDDLIVLYFLLHYVYILNYCNASMLHKRVGRVYYLTIMVRKMIPVISVTMPLPVGGSLKQQGLERCIFKLCIHISVVRALVLEGSVSISAGSILL